MAVNSLTRDTLTNTVKYSSMLAGNIPDFSSDFLITETILTGNAASVTFDVSTFAAEGYKHLQIRAVVRTSHSASYDETYVGFNSDTTAGNYKSHILYGTGSAASSTVWTNGSKGFRVADIAAASLASSIFTPIIIDVADPFSSTKNKTAKSFSGITSLNFISFSSGLWMSNSAVSSVIVSSGNGSFVAGSRFSIYGSKG